MEKKTRKKSQLSKGFDKFNIIAIIIIVIIILFAVGFGITKIVYKPNKSSEMGDYNKNIFNWFPIIFQFLLLFFIDDCFFEVL